MVVLQPLRCTSLLALFLSLLLILPDNAITALARKDSKTSADDTFDPNFVPTEEQRQNYVNNNGNAVVHEVWSVLRDFEPTWKDSVIASDPSGVVQTLWHYTKVVFRFLFMNTPTRDGPAQEHEEYVVKGDLRHGVETLQNAAAFDDPDAIFLLAEMNFHGNFSHPRRPKQAYKWYTKLADLNGNSTAHYILGLMHATGIGGVEQDQAKALVYHNFAAEQGNIRSEMTLAFRHHSGIGTTRDCDKAVSYYKRVADKAVKYWQEGPPGGHSFLRNSYRWAEMTGGVYGEGASASSAGLNARGEGVVTSNIDDVLEYLSMRESSGDHSASLTLGKHYYEPPRGYKRNLRKASKQFGKITKLYWTKDGKVNPKAPKGIEKVAGKAAAYIGRMFLRGEGTAQDLEKANLWFKRGLANGDPFAQYHLGIMYRDGLGVPKDGSRAGTFFQAAAEQGLAIAQSALGVLFLDQGDVDTAGRYFELAAGSGIMEAFYYLAELTNQGIGRDRNCGLATAYYKAVSEKAETLHTPFIEANAAYERGDLERAFIASLMAAEQGYEHAQANVAYLLDRKTSMMSLKKIPFLSNLSKTATSTRSRLLDNASLALVYFTRSAKQANIDSLVKMGDYYIAGDALTGVEASIEKATSCYTAAAEGHHSAQALWNLGWMHENGLGSVAQDFHMAKRYYDLAYEMNKEAYLPVKLALAKLRFRSWWNGISGGKVNSIRDDEDENGQRRKPKSFREWLNQFLESAEEMNGLEEGSLRSGPGGIEGEGADPDGNALADGLEYPEPGMPGGDADYAARAGGAGRRDAADADGLYHDHMHNEEWDEFDDGLVESLIIIALAGALALLVYARQARQRGIEDERRRGLGQPGGPPPVLPLAQPGGPPPVLPLAQPGAAAVGAGVVGAPAGAIQGQAPAQSQAAGYGQQAQGQAQGQQVGAGAGAGGQPGQGGGLFPQPGDPELNNWVVGGVGH